MTATRRTRGKRFSVTVRHENVVCSREKRVVTRSRDGVSAATRAARPCRRENLAFRRRRRGENQGHACLRVRVRAFGTRGSAKKTHRQHVVVVVAELLLGEQAQVLRARVEPQRRLHGCSSLRRTGFFRDAASPTVPDARGEGKRASTEGVGQCGSGGGAVACRARAFESDGVTRASRRTRFREPVKITALGLVESRTVVIPAESAPSSRLTLEISAPTETVSRQCGFHELSRAFLETRLRYVQCRLRWRARAPASRGTS